MSEVRRIGNLLRATYNGKRAWHGTPVRQLLDGLTAEQASARPLPGAHSIWELVAHMTGWRTVVADSIEGKDYRMLPDGENWPAIAETSPGAWQEALAALDRSQERMLEGLKDLAEEKLAENVPGDDYPIYYMLHGVMAHDLYHAGQIGMLKKGLT